MAYQLKYSFGYDGMIIPFREGHNTIMSNKIRAERMFASVSGYIGSKGDKCFLSLFKNRLQNTCDKYDAA